MFNLPKATPPSGVPVHASEAIAIPNSVVEMPVGFMIVLAPSKGRKDYAERLANAFSSGALTFADEEELGPVSYVPGDHTALMLHGEELTTSEHLDNFIGQWDDETEEQFVEPNSLIIIDYIDTFTPDGAHTFELIQEYAEETKSRVIGIRRQ
jgi:hypothetical protein